MIFKTIDDDSTLSGQRIVSTFEARKIAQDKLTASLKEQAAQLEVDRQELSLLEEKVKSGMTYEQAYAESIRKASVAAKEHAVSTKGVSGATDTFVAKQKKAQAELEATATSSKVAAVGVKALKLAFNLFSGLVISFAILKIIEGFQYLSESAERAKEKLENIRTDLTDNQSSYESNRKTLEGLRDEYDSLTKKADELGGVQNLTNEEYQRYTEIMSQILGITPKLITGWDDEGNAISNKNGLLQQSIDLLDEEYEKSLRNNTTKKKNEEVSEGIITELKEFESSGDTKSNGDTINPLVLGFIKSLRDADVKNKKLNDYDIAEQLYTYLYPDAKDLTELSQKTGNWIDRLQSIIYDKNDYEKLAKSFTDKNNPIYNLFSDETIDDMIENANEYFQELDRIQSDRETYYQKFKDQLNWDAQAATDGSGQNAYKQLSDESKSAITEYINNLDYASIKTSDDFIVMANNVKSFTKTLASDSTFADYIDDIFTPQGEDESIKDYTTRVENAISEIQKYCDENGITIPFNFGTDDSPKSVQKTVNDLQDKYDAAINRFTQKMDARSAKQLRDAKERNDIALLSELEKKFGITDRNILSNFFDTEGVNAQEKIDYFNEVTKTAKTATEAIEMYKKASFDTSEHSLSDIFELKTDDNTLTSLGKISEEIDKIQTAAKGLKEAMDTYNATGVISIDQLQSILSYGDEYLKYITDENGNLVLNEQAIKNVTQARLEELRAKTLENLLSNLENIDNEATAQAYLKSQVLETAQSYEDLAVAEIQAWQAKMLAKSEKGETDLTVATINEVTEGYIRQANAINNLFNNTNLASVFETSTSASKDTETVLDRITKKYKELTDVIGSNVNLILSQIKLLEAQGKEVGSAYYTELVDQSSAKIAVLTEQFNELRKEFLNTPKGTDEWLELNSAILEVQNSIIEAKTSMAEYQKTLDNMKWDRAEKIFNATSDTISSNADLLEAEINRIEANGERVGKVFYAGLIGTVEKNIAILTDRHKTLMEQLSTVEEGSDDWIELNKSIFDCQKSIIEAQKSLTEYNKTLNDIDWEKYQTIFENSTDIVSNYKDGIQTQIDIAEAQGKEVGKAYYEALISATETENDIYINRRQELLNQLGTVNEGSDEWLEIKSSIADIDQSILDCQKDIIEYQKTLKDIDFERSTEKYNAVKDVISANEDLIQAQMSQIESAGGSVGKAFYEALISNAEKSIQTETERLSELQARLLSIDEGSEEWNSLNTEILEVQSSILNAKEKIEGFQNSIDQLHWNTVDDIAEAINRISDETGNIVDLLDTDTVLDDNGLLAKDAITALAMYGEQLETAQYLINKYSKEIEYLNGEYIKGTITVEEYNSKMQDLNDKQWESVDAYNAAKKAIIELRKKAIEEEIDALEELYDARKKAWEQEKDQHDWEKTVSENETNINKLKAQIAELQNDNSLAGIKKRKELEDELKKTESDWEDTLYDHVYDERQDQLDKELEDKKKALEKTLDDEEKLVADSIDLVNKNCSTVLDNLTDLSKKYGIQISNSITEGFKDGENALSSYSSKFTVAHSKFTSQLEITEKKVCDVQSQADATAKSLIDMFNSTNGTLDTQLDITSGKINQAHIDADNAANAFLAMLQTQDGTLGQQIDNVRNKIEISYKTADEASLHFYQMLTAKNGTLDSQIDNTRSKIQDMYMTADTASQHIVNMFKSTNGTLGEQLSKTREAIQAIIDKANEANNALKNAGIGNGADSTPTLTPTNSGLGSTAHDNSGTTLPNAGTWKNADQDIAKDKAEAANTKKAIDKIVQVEEKKKNQGSSKSTIGGGSKSKFTTISMGYASGTKSATKGLHPICEDGVEIIEKDGCLIYPIGAFDGGEKVFNNEQTQRLWELSQNPDVMEKFRQELLNIKPCIDFKFGNTAPVTKTNQNVNVQQHFDALVKVEGDMTPDVYKQLATDKRIDSLLEGKTFKYLANAYNTRGYKL